VYAVAVAEPGHGNVGPLVMGITIFALAEAGADSTDLLQRYSRRSTLLH